MVEQVANEGGAAVDWKQEAGHSGWVVAPPPLVVPSLNMLDEQMARLEWVNYIGFTNGCCFMCYVITVFFEVANDSTEGQSRKPR